MKFSKREIPLWRNFLKNFKLISILRRYPLYLGFHTSTSACHISHPPSTPTLYEDDRPPKSLPHNHQPLRLAHPPAKIFLGHHHHHHQEPVLLLLPSSELHPRPLRQLPLLPRRLAHIHLHLSLRRGGRRNRRAGDLRPAVDDLRPGAPRHARLA